MIVLFLRVIGFLLGTHVVSSRTNRLSRGSRITIQFSSVSEFCGRISRQTGTREISIQFKSGKFNHVNFTHQKITYPWKQILTCKSLWTLVVARISYAFGLTIATLCLPLYLRGNTRFPIFQNIHLKQKKCLKVEHHRMNASILIEITPIFFLNKYFYLRYDLLHNQRNIPFISYSTCFPNIRHAFTRMPGGLPHR